MAMYEVTCPACLRRQAVRRPSRSLLAALPVPEPPQEPLACPDCGADITDAAVRQDPGRVDALLEER
jgi:hypothetical protein